MGTRAHITVKWKGEYKKTLYKDVDGYLVGVGVDLIRYLIYCKSLKSSFTIPIVHHEDFLTTVGKDYEIIEPEFTDVDFFYTVYLDEERIRLTVRENKHGSGGVTAYSYTYKTKEEKVFIEEKAIKRPLENKVSIEEVRSLAKITALQNTGKTQ
jgi:hypothetical protein